VGQIRKRRQNRGIRKICGCPRRQWPKCPHSWHFNFKPKGGTIAYRFSVDSEAGKHIEGKTEAEALADAWRTQIREGTFRRRAEMTAPSAAPAATADVITLAKFAETFVERVSQVRERNKSWKNDKYNFETFAAFTLTDGSRLGDKPLGAITEDDLEAFLAALRAKGHAASTRNHYVQLLKASFRWATKKGYLARNPISEDSALTRAKIAKRHRRLVPDVLDKDGKLVEPGEERRLPGRGEPASSESHHRGARKRVPLW
jgi:integrase